MPKTRRKDRVRSQLNKMGDVGEDEYMDDCASVVSVISNNSENRLTDDSEDSTSIQQSVEDYEFKIIKCIEGITQKNLKGRIDSLKSLKAGLSVKFAYDFITERRVTLCDGLERCIKKGRGEEQITAAVCLCALFVQVGCSEEKEELFRSSTPLLRSVACNESVPMDARCECLEALGLIAFISTEEPADFYELMTFLEGIFRASYDLGEDFHPQKSQTVSGTKLHNSALMSWNLLFTIVPQTTMVKYVHMYLPSIASMLKSNDMELRITAGETVALMFELAGDEENFEIVTNYNELVDSLKSLITESSKFRAKKDKKVQRSKFRDIYRMVESGEFDQCDLKISDLEKVSIDSWVSKVRYDSICKILGSGMNLQLQENPLLREIFLLGDPICMESQTAFKASKLEKKFNYKAGFKSRTQSRTKQRSNKMVEFD